jgi:hypothetical protein
MQRRPTLLSSCAWAATAAEARFRIDYPRPANRASLVIALDRQAAVTVTGITDQSWSGGRFLAFERSLRANGGWGEPADAVLLAADGSPALLAAELDGADVVVVIATGMAGAEAATVIGDACAGRMIMLAGLVVGAPGSTDEVISALRPNAMVLVELGDDSDVREILTALRV